MVTVPSGSEPQVAFISGVTDAGRLAATSFATWKGRKPAIYDATFARELKWGSTTIGTSGETVTYGFDGPSQWTSVEQGAIEASLAFVASLFDDAEQNGHACWPTPQRERLERELEV